MHECVRPKIVELQQINEVALEQKSISDKYVEMQ
jgi:hypothetical protein